MAWVKKTSLRGPQGARGETGLPGPAAVENDVAFAAALKTKTTQSHAVLVSEDPRMPAYNLAPDNFTKWRAAKARALNGGAAAKLLIIGDSTSQGAATVAKSYPTALVAALTRRGLPARPGIIAPATTIPDTRWAPNGSWVKSGTSGPGGSGLWFSPPSSDSLYFAPHIPGTEIRIHFLRQSGGGSCRLGRGAVLVGNIVTGTGTANTYGSVAFPLTIAADDVFAIEGPTVGNVLLLGAETIDANNPHAVAVHNWAQTGTTTDHWVNGLRSRQAVSYLAPDLTIISLGINDSIGSVAQADYQARMETLIADARATGDVLVMTPVRSDPAFATGISARQASYEAGVIAYCAANGIPVFDLATRIGPYATSPWRMDQVHQSDAANQDIASVLTELLIA